MTGNISTNISKLLWMLSSQEILLKSLDISVRKWAVWLVAASVVGHAVVQWNRWVLKRTAVGCFSNRTVTFVVPDCYCCVYRLYDNDADEIHAWYARGVGLSSFSELPVFLAWEPEPGWEEDRLWRKGWTWALIMGLGWLPCLGSIALCVLICSRS
jgi:hypothetical protein